MKVPYFRTISASRFILLVFISLALGPLGILLALYLVRDVEVEE